MYLNARYIFIVFVYITDTVKIRDTNVLNCGVSIHIFNKFEEINVCQTRLFL